jgi:hypothetical protein
MYSRLTATTEWRGQKTFTGILKKGILNIEIMKLYHPISEK